MVVVMRVRDSRMNVGGCLSFAFGKLLRHMRSPFLHCMRTS
jgi:hypothetical protein